MAKSMKASIDTEEAKRMFEEEAPKTYRKKVFTKMLRMDGPFTVATSEGPLTCQDGFLAMDARGYPYPIAADEHAFIYEEVEDE